MPATCARTQQSGPGRGAGPARGRSADSQQQGQDLAADGVALEREEVVEAVRRVALVADRNTPVRLEFADGSLALAAGGGVEQ